MGPLNLGFIDNLMPRPGRNPYYITVPRYVRTSAGIRALHLLCHWLNCTGQSAFILLYPDWDGLKVHPDLLTPVLDAAIVRYHFDQGLTPITIYPEVMSGNPLNAPLRVRWIGNYPGHLGGESAYDPAEICVAFSERLAAAAMPGTHVLTVPIVDTSTYKPVPVVPRSGTCYYAAKFKHVHNGEVFGLPEGCFEIVRDRPDQLSPPEIADLFRRSDLFYCFEDSALIIEATLCGCPVVLMKNEHFSWPLGVDETGWDGLAWGPEPTEIERARKTVPLAYDNYAHNIPKFFTQLHNFILVTQRRASFTPYLSPMELPGSVAAHHKVVGGWRQTLHDTILELHSLKSDSFKSSTVWVPDLAKSGVDSVVTFLAGWGDPRYEAGRMAVERSLIGITPPAKAAFIELNFAIGATSSPGATLDVYWEQDFLQKIELRGNTNPSVRVPIAEQCAPLLVGLVYSNRNLQKGPPQRPPVSLASVCVQYRIDGDKEPGEGSSGSNSQKMKSGGGVERISLMELPRGAYSTLNCSLNFNAQGLNIEATGNDPNLCFKLNSRLLTKGRHVYLWGVYESDAEEELQVFVPDPTTGVFSEELSIRYQITPGTNAFSLALPSVDAIGALRIDPLHNVGRISFSHLELVREVEPSKAAPQTIAVPLPNIERFDVFSLIHNVSPPATHRCSFRRTEDGARVAVNSASPLLLFSFPEVQVGSSVTMFLRGEYSSDLEELMVVSVPGEETEGGSQSSIKVPLQRGKGAFSVELPWNDVKGLHVVPRQYPGVLEYHKLDLVFLNADLTDRHLKSDEVSGDVKV